VTGFASDLRVSGAPRSALAGPLTIGAAGVAVVAALVLIGGNAAGRPGLAVAVIAVQAVLVIAWCQLFSLAVESAAIVVLAVAVADFVLLRTRAATGGSIAGVLGLSVIAVLFHQVARRSSRSVTEVVAVTLSAIVIACAVALLLPLRELGTGRAGVFAGVVTAAAAIAAARLLPGPDPVRRIAGLAIAAGAGAVCGLPKGGLSVADGLYVGLAAGAAALLVDRLVERSSLPRSSRGEVLVSVVVAGLLPLMLAAPIAYLAGRIIASGGG
jgi:hypothetical protein